MNPDWHPAYTPSDSTGPHAFSPLGAGTGTVSWGQDGFSHDPGFLASQEELRCMLFTIAQSAAPTRAPSPDGQVSGGDAPVQGRRPALSNARRVQYLKNYVGQVAPWVSLASVYGRNNRVKLTMWLVGHVRFRVYIPRTNPSTRAYFSGTS